MITVLVKESGFFWINLLNVFGIRDHSFADASSSNITRLPLLMPLTCQDFFFWLGEGGKEGKVRNIYYIE